MLFELDHKSFESLVLKTKDLVLVFFSANFCLNCKALEPILEDLLEEYYGELKIYKVDSEKEEKLADHYEVFTLPTLLLFKEGLLIKELNGLNSKKKVIEWLDI